MMTDESSTLLPTATPPPQQDWDERRHTRRVHVLRVAVGVVSALTLVAGSVVAVDALSARQQQSAVSTASMRETAPQTLEAQLGWGTWCSVKASIGCLFSADNDKCQEEILATCDPEGEQGDDDHAGHEHHGGDGSGSGFGEGSGSGLGVDAGSSDDDAYQEYVPSVGDPENKMPRQSP